MFTVPDCDISSYELSVGQPERQWNDVVSGISRERIKVEMAPGVSTYLKVGSRTDSSLGASPIQMPNEREKQGNPEEIEDFEKIRFNLWK